MGQRRHPISTMTTTQKIVIRPVPPLFYGPDHPDNGKTGWLVWYEPGPAPHDGDMRPWVIGTRHPTEARAIEHARAAAAFDACPIFTIRDGVEVEVQP